MPKPITAIDVPLEDQLPNNLLSKVELLLQTIIHEHELFQRSLYLAQTKSADSAKAQKTVFFIYTSEAPFPCRKDEPRTSYIDKPILSLEYKRKTDTIIITTANDVTEAINKSFESQNDQGYHYSFPATKELLDSIKSVIEFKLRTYVSTAASFDCCSSFIECSDLKKCVHENKLYATCCTYRHHLEDGHIFYGKNKNVDNQGNLIEKVETEPMEPAVVCLEGSTISIGLNSGKGNAKELVGRVDKGRNIILFPDEFVIIDIETTGLSPDWDDIIEVSGVRYNKAFVEIDHFSELVRPEGVQLSQGGYQYVSDFITELTGITNEMLASARSTKEVLPEFLDYLGDTFVIGYNVNFDINFIYDNAKCLGLPPFSNNFMDLMRLARKLYPDMKHHRLEDMASVYEVDYSNAHRSLKDCYITAEVFRGLYKKAILTCGAEEEVIAQFCKHHKTRVKAADIVANINPENIDKNNVLYGKTVVFTGTLERFERKVAMQLVMNLGGLPADSITRKTDFLVLGNNDYCSTIKNGKSTKQKKAEALKLEGLGIEIIPEKLFYEMIEEGE